jgi:hypothetical protein
VSDSRTSFLPPRTGRGFAWAHALAFLLIAAAGYFFAKTFTRRMAWHEGYALVRVEDRVATPPERPRHAVVMLVDGLGEGFSRGMRITSQLARVGQCRRTWVGAVSVSRPVYASLSSGVEPERTGVRVNSPKSPAAVESIWQVARRAGLRVHAVSELDWWGTLFPDGFDGYWLLPRAVDYGAVVPLADLTLVHPIYVDESGHDHGAASTEYADAVRRADAEAERLLARLDLSRDVFVFTADHGHVARGGHGGVQPEVSYVTTCFDGRGVRRVAPGDPNLDITSRDVGPAVAMLLGLRFPAHMRATDDDLDHLESLLDPAAFPAGYLADRRAAVERYRGANGAFVGKLVGAATPASWSSWYAVEARHTNERALIGLAALALLLGVAFAGRRFGEWSRALAYVLAVPLAIACVWTLVRGGYDMTSVNAEDEFVRWAFIVSTSVGVVLAIVLGVAVRSDPMDPRALAAGKAWLETHLAACAVLLGTLLVHVFAWGWPLGPTLPAPPLYFYPLLTAISVLAASLVGLLVALALGVRPSRDLTRLG